MRPECPHGPTLSFTAVDKQKARRRFFACSACRQRKDCNIFVWADEPHAYLRKHWAQKRREFMADANHRKRHEMLTHVRQVPAADRVYCHDCDQFQLPRGHRSHLGHRLLKGIADDALARPSAMLTPLSNAKKEAQFLFEPKCCRVIADTLVGLGYKQVLCVGTPRLHECIANDYSDQLDSLLLDIDKRYMSFYSTMHFVWYNMFNHHFFQEDGKLAYEEFLTNSKRNQLVIIADPPFGGRVEFLAVTFNKIRKDFRLTQKLPEDVRVPLFWIFPYFMEGSIKKCLPDMSMLDYRVDYVNHPLFSDGPKGRKHGSPVRIFTNVDPARVLLPKEDNYRFCKVCERWVSEANRHCKKCNDCTSKNGKTYVHCDKCSRCVKPTWVHCENCSKCAHPEHHCTTPDERPEELLRLSEEDEEEVPPLPKAKRKRNAVKMKANVKKAKINKSMS